MTELKAKYLMFARKIDYYLADQCLSPILKRFSDFLVRKEITQKPDGSIL